MHSYLTDAQIDQLLKPLNPRRVKNRSVSGQTLSYLEQHDVRAHLTRIFGFGRWSSRVVNVEQLFETEVPIYDKQNKPVVDTATGEVKTRWNVAWRATVELTIDAEDGTLLCSHSDVAVGGNTQPQRHEANDMALKTAVSDALKRAAVNLGDQFGAALYDKDGATVLVRDVLVGRTNRPEPNTEHDDKLAASIGMEVAQAAAS